MLKKRWLYDIKMLIGKYVNMRIFWHQCFFWYSLIMLSSYSAHSGWKALWRFVFCGNLEKEVFCKIWLLRIYPDSWNLGGQRQSPGTLVLNQDKDKVLGSCCWINPFKRYLIIFGNWFARYFLREKSKNYINVATL